MNDTQKIKVGIALLIAQCLLLAMTFGFHAAMDAQAERAGIADIIREAVR